ncbi:uncharacterized protein LOC133518363 [Cydia pomonella]|uniref:uncharacterized protein LOC133518363 n=1 Tax=Cydia pomonella TaxID=82600 RepID=UPI002ADE04DC|nr:uncharacterized protein LOC133518363 [Cydia pomonella]
MVSVLLARHSAVAAAAMSLSPLVRLLLAFAALLAAANAKITLIDIGLGAKCVKFIMEIPSRAVSYQPSNHGPRFTMKSHGHSQPLTLIPNKCAAYNEEIARQTVEVCNEYPTPYGPQPLPPTVQALADNVLSPVFASCGDDTECGPLVWKIQQDCRIPVRPLISSLY